MTYAQINLWATLVGAIFAVGVGRLIDQWGSRIVLTGVTAALGLVVCFMSQAASVPALIAFITLTRGFGQSALSVVSITMVGQWFVRRVDVAMTVYTIVLSVGFMAAFPTVGALVQTWGWRAAWWTLGCVLLLGLLPLGWLVVRRSPEAHGLVPDGLAVRPDAEGTARRLDESDGDDWQLALRTGAFWVFALGAALYGLVASGIGLFNEAILAERGFGPTMYYNTLVVTAMTALLGNFAGGWLARRIALTAILTASLLILAAGLVALPHVSSPHQVALWATAMGLGGGFVTVLFFTAWPRLFGRRHLGRIQGVAQAITVVASAVGPLPLAWCVERTGSYAAAFYALAVPIVLVAVASLVVTVPARALRA